MAVVAAHAAQSKAPISAHHAQGASSVVPADEAALFAELLSKTGETGESPDAAPDTVETLLRMRMAVEKSKKTQDNATPIIAPADTTAQPAANALLTVTLSQESDPVSQVTALKSESVNMRERGALSNNDLSGDTALEGHSQAAPPDGAAEAAARALEGIASAMPATGNGKVSAAAQNLDGIKTAQSQTQTSDPANGAQKTDQTPSDIGAKQQPTDTGNRSVKDFQPRQTASKSEFDAQATADKADVLEANADKSLKQATADQAPQARILPVNLASPATGQDNKAGSDTGKDHSKDSPQPDARPAQRDAGPQLRDNVMPASGPSTSSAAATPQAPAHLQTPAGAVHPAPTQVAVPNSSPAAAATLQVSPQLAQAAAQPDLTSLAIQIAAKSGEGVRHFDIRIDPPELGRVEVKLSIDDSGHAQAHLAVEKPQTLDLLQSDRGTLERALKDSGLNLSQNGLSFSLKGQDKQNGQPPPLRGRSLAVTQAIEAASGIATVSTSTFVTGNARLDIRV